MLLYINSATPTDRGFLSVGGNHVHDFQHLVNEVATQAVIDPETAVPIGERLRAKMRIDALEPDAKEHVKAEAKIAADPDKDFPIRSTGVGLRLCKLSSALGRARPGCGFRRRGRQSRCLPLSL